MSTRSMICLLASLAVLATGVPALAQRDDHRDSRPGERAAEQRQNARQGEFVQRERAHRERDARQDGRRGAREDRERQVIRGRYDTWDGRGRAYDRSRSEWRGAGPFRNYYRGGRLPPQFNHRHYVVNDWRGHRLGAPPRGHHWVQTGSDYLLVVIATGVIVQMLLDY